MDSTTTLMCVNYSLYEQNFFIIILDQAFNCRMTRFHPICLFHLRAYVKQFHFNTELRDRSLFIPGVGTEEKRKTL